MMQLPASTSATDHRSSAIRAAPPRLGRGRRIPAGWSLQLHGDTRVLMEGTAGFWFKLYDGSKEKVNKGRIQFGPQFSYVTRNAWSGAVIPERAARNRQHDLHVVPLLPAVERAGVELVQEYAHTPAPGQHERRPGAVSLDFSNQAPEGSVGLESASCGGSSDALY